MNLSVLKNVKEGQITYYVGDNYSDIKHINNCTIYTKKYFEGLDNVTQIVVDDPQLEFYKLSHTVENDYKFDGNIKYNIGENCEIHSSVIIGNGVKIGNNVSIGPNTVIFSKTIIEDNVIVGSNCTIGAEGVMWVWDNDEKVFLKQLGGVIIHKNCFIGSNSAIVRGSANENTIIEYGVNLAPGCFIGHGTYIGKNTHLANNVSTGGSSYINERVFIGTGSIINAGVKIKSKDIILGSGTVVNKDLSEQGIYAGCPARKLKNNIESKIKGVPSWSVK